MMGTMDFAGAYLTDTLDVNALPQGVVTRLLIQINHDPLGQARRLPVFVARGAKPGPVFGITAAVHGNEINGIPVMHRLFERIDCRTLKGTVVGVLVVNMPGFLSRSRMFNARMDLNHLFPGDPGGSAAHIYAHRLMDRVIRHFDYIVDMHTASIGRINSLYIRADMTDETTARMAYLQRPQIIVHNPPSDGTLRGAAMDLGIPSITLEIGNPSRFHRDYIKRSLMGLRAVLADARMLPGRKVAAGAEPIICARSQWLYTDHGGLLAVYPEVTERVEAGQPVARLVNIYGDVLKEYRAPTAGVVIGKSVNPVGQTGARILHLGIEATEEDKTSFHARPGSTKEKSP